jgi:BirA family biotin operon repressor/biotin-[acetyl-CoA-carboxylase] ligase
MIIKKYKILNSTNLKAKELAKRGAEAWTVIVAKEQTAGYGRKGLAWFSPEGGLYFSIILPKSKVAETSSHLSPRSASLRSVIEDLQTLTILAAFICAKTIKENFNLEPFIKLPNDLYLNGKKVGGILTENIVGKDVKLSVMGIGLNTNIEKFPKDLENIATSLKIELAKEVDNEKILEQIIKGLKEQLAIISD